jgi:protein-tyrosine phosphatase
MDNYNTNSKVSNYSDFCNNWESEKEKLKKTKRSFQPNSDRQNHTTDNRNEYNPVTHKITAYTKDEVEDALDKMEEKNEGVLSDIPSEEYSINDDIKRDLMEMSSEDGIEYLNDIISFCQSTIKDIRTEKMDESKVEKSESLEDCPSFKEFNKSISDLKKVTKKIHSELKRGTKGEIDDYIEKKIFGRDV